MKILLPVKWSCHVQESAREFGYPGWLFFGCLGTFIGSWEVNSQSYPSQNIQARYSLSTYFTFLSLLKETEMSACKTICLCSTLKEVSHKIMKEWPILVMSLGNFGLHAKKKKKKVSPGSSRDSFLSRFPWNFPVKCSCPKLVVVHRKEHCDTSFYLKPVPFSQGDVTHSCWRMGYSYLH